MSAALLWASWQADQLPYSTSVTGLQSQTSSPEATDENSRRQNNQKDLIRVHLRGFCVNLGGLDFSPLPAKPNMDMKVSSHCKDQKKRDCR